MSRGCSAACGGGEGTAHSPRGGPEGMGGVGIVPWRWGFEGAGGCRGGAAGCASELIYRYPLMVNIRFHGLIWSHCSAEKGGSKLVKLNVWPGPGGPLAVGKSSNGKRCLRAG